MQPGRLWESVGRFRESGRFQIMKMCYPPIPHLSVAFSRENGYLGGDFAPLTLPRVAGGMFWVVGPETTYRLLHAGEYHQLEFWL